MYKINETNLREPTNNLAAIKDSFGKWVQLYIKTESKVIVTSNQKKILKRKVNIQILGELSKDQSKRISDKIYAGKKVKARICDFSPSFMTNQNTDSVVKISIWEN